MSILSIFKHMATPATPAPAPTPAPSAPVSLSIPNLPNLSLTLPGENAVVALTGLVKDVIDGQDAATKKEIWDRYIQLTAPWQTLAVSASNKIAGWLDKILGLDPAAPSTPTTK